MPHHILICQSEQQPISNLSANDNKEHKMAEKVGDTTTQTVEQVGTNTSGKDVSISPRFLLSCGDMVN